MGLAGDPSHTLRSRLVALRHALFTFNFQSRSIWFGGATCRHHQSVLSAKASLTHLLHSSWEPGWILPLQVKARSVHRGAFALAYVSGKGQSRSSYRPRPAAQVVCRSLHGPNPVPYNCDIMHDMIHFKTTDNTSARDLTKTDVNDHMTWQNPFQHSVWSQDEVNCVRPTHRETKCLADRIAHQAVQWARKTFDRLSGYHPDKMTQAIVLNCVIFLETITGCPGMAGGMMRHLSSLRNMRRDHGWIHTLLEEAENERMHLLVFVTLKQPGALFRCAVIGAQGLFMTAFLTAYAIYPPVCHRVVGYLEEEAVHTYTDIIRAIDLNIGDLGEWKTELAPQIAVDYWHMRPGATMSDLMLVVRADQDNHHKVNHTFADLSNRDVNPYVKQKHNKARQTRQSMLLAKKENKEFIREVLRAPAPQTLHHPRLSALHHEPHPAPRTPGL